MTHILISLAMLLIVSVLVAWNRTPKRLTERRSRILAGECHKRTVAEGPTVILYHDPMQADHTPPTYKTYINGGVIHCWDSEP